MVPGVPWCSGEAAKLAQQSFQPLAKGIRTVAGRSVQVLSGRSFQLEVNEQVQVVGGQKGSLLAQSKEVPERSIALESLFRRLNGWGPIGDLLGHELRHGAKFAIRPFERASFQPSGHGKGKVGMTRPPSPGTEQLEEGGQGVLGDVLAGKKSVSG